MLCGRYNMDDFSQQILTTKREERYKNSKYFVNTKTGELKEVIAKFFLPKGKYWVRLSRKAFEVLYGR